MENLYLIVGLGNPGAEYAKTRHNAGFLATGRLAEHWRVGWNYAKKFNVLLARMEQAERKVLLSQPQTFMNSSGEAVRALMDYYQVSQARLLVILDDADLPLGELRMRPGGGSGGHHGLESVQQHLGSRDYARLRIGIGRQDGAREITNYVLGRFQSTEAELVDRVLNAACAQAECWVGAGIQKAMSQFNGAVKGSEEERKEQ